MSAVYYIFCSENQRIYVGSTRRSTRQRWLEHLHYLRNKKHHSKHLQRTYDKYGESSFSFHIAEKVEDPNMLLAREQFHIWRFPQNMNGAPVSDSIFAAHAANRGRVMSEEERQRRSEAVKAGYKNYDFSDRQTEERRAALRRGWVKRKANKGPDPRTDQWVNLYQQGKGLREISALVGGTRATIRKSLTELGIFDRDRKYEMRDETKDKIQNTKRKWIDVEINNWIKLFKDGVSIREIERTTGRCRKVIARELRRVGILE